MCRFVTYFFLIIFSVKVFSSDSTQADLQKTKYSISLAVKYCYPGYSIAPALEIERNNHNVVIGPVFMLSDFYVPGDITTGIQLGWRLNLRDHDERRPLVFFCTVDYQLIPYTVRLRSLNRQKINYIHDINFGYGIKYQVTNPLAILNSVSTGLYVESYYNSFTKKHETITGIDILIRMSIIYSFAQ